MRGERPYRVVTGSADSMVGLYEGPPFKFVRNVKEHAEKVMCVRYSPDMESIATVSRSGDIVLLDGKTADTQKSIKTGHKGSIFSLAWSADGCKIVTASADKCVKIFDVCTGSLVATCAIGTAAADMQQGIVYTTQGIVSSSLSGKLTVVNEQGEVLRSILGHQGRILLVHKEPSGLIVSVSVDRVLVWQDDKAAAVGNAYEVPLATDMINAAAASEGKLFLKAGDELLCYTLNDSKLDVLLKEAASVMALAPTVDGYIALLMKNSFVIAGPDGGKVAEEKFERFDGSSAASFGQMVAFGGDKVVKLYRVAPGAPPVETLCFSGHHTGCVSCVAFSHDGLLLASGDACRNIFVWSSTDGSLLYKDLVFHTLRVTSLAFSPANKGWLFSGGMDASLIVWDLESKKRRMEDMAHRGGVSAVFWAADETLLSGGSDGCVRIWKRE
ncbi:Anaphase promoting complex subunit 4 WD40 domain [Trypanosoma vivax]|nr:Anaphase promoting complex subunit 4 WD40 domain [Trypanosoma vivax]